MFANNVKMTLMDRQDDNFGVRLGKRIWEAGLNAHRVSKLSGVDYPLLNKLINHPDKFKPTMDVLDKLETVPCLSDFIVKEKMERLLNEYDPDILLEGTLRLLGRDPIRAAKIKSRMHDLLGGI